MLAQPPLSNPHLCEIHYILYFIASLFSNQKPGYLLPE